MCSSGLKLVSLLRSIMRYQKVPRDDSSLLEALHQLVNKHPTIGFWKCYYRLRRKGYDCNNKKDLPGVQLTQAKCDKKG